MGIFERKSDHIIIEECDNFMDKWVAMENTGLQSNARVIHGVVRHFIFVYTGTNELSGTKLNTCLDYPDKN